MSDARPTYLFAEYALAIVIENKLVSPVGCVDTLGLLTLVLIITPLALQTSLEEGRVKSKNVAVQDKGLSGPWC